MKVDADGEMHTEKADGEMNKKEVTVMPPSVARREGQGCSGRSLSGQRDGQRAALAVIIPHMSPVQVQDWAGPRDGRRAVPNTALPTTRVAVLSLPVSGLARARNAQ